MLKHKRNMLKLFFKPSLLMTAMQILLIIIAIKAKPGISPRSTAGMFTTPKVLKAYSAESLALEELFPVKKEKLAVNFFEMHNFLKRLNGLSKKLHF